MVKSLLVIKQINEVNINNSFFLNNSCVTELCFSGSILFDEYRFLQVYP